MKSSSEQFPITGRYAVVYFALVLLLSTELQYAGAQSTNSTNAAYQNQYASFSSSTGIVVLALISALFLVGVISLYLRHCTNFGPSGNTLPVVTGRNGGRSRRANRGLDASVISTFPIFAYSAVKDLKLGKGALECAVCLNEYEDDETLRLMPKCDHVFHSECIDAWLSSHVTCPVCRANLATPAGESPIAGQIIIPVPVNSEVTSNELIHRSNENESQDSVFLRIFENPNGEGEVKQESGVLGHSRSTNQSRRPRSRSVSSYFPSKISRSNSTGHSVIQPGDNVDRFTLKLPEEVRKQIMNRTLNRTTSLLTLPRETSSRRGHRTGGNWSSKGKPYKSLESLDRVGESNGWVFSMAPPFLVRAPSPRSTKTMANDDEGTSTTAPEVFKSSLKKSLNSLNSIKIDPSSGSVQQP